jgi:uncharacterized protein (DUF58 family)
MVIIVGVILVVVGHRTASVPLVAAGSILLLTAIADGVIFLLVSIWFPVGEFSRVLDPNPCFMGYPVRVRLVGPPGSRMGSTGIEEWVPEELTGYVQIAPRGKRLPGSVLEYDVHPPRRGVWSLGPATVNRFSAVGLWWTRVVGHRTDEVIVWPEIRPLGLAVRAQDREGVVGRTTYAQPHQDNATVRPYSPGDDLRRVHWRSSARHDELMTRAEEPTDADRAWVGLTVGEQVPSQVRELAICLAASWIVEVAHIGFTIDLSCGGQARRASREKHLTRLALLSDEEVSRPVSFQGVEGMTMMILAGHHDDIVPTPPGGVHGFTSALAVFLSGDATDHHLWREAGWSVLRLEPSSTLDQGIAQMSRFADAMRAQT